MALLSLPNIIFSVCAFIVCLLALYVYRIYLDPLSKFPGPKLAAASLWYEFYYDVVKKGRYTWEIAKMHDKYGTYKWFTYRLNPRLHLFILARQKIRRSPVLLTIFHINRFHGLKVE